MALAALGSRHEGVDAGGPVAGLGTQKGQSEDWPFCLNLLARPERFERPTPWFVAKYYSGWAPRLIMPQIVSFWRKIN